ncbi:RHS repeat-associated core domain-containing protein [Saccharopolyspora sp. NPDC049357]|uniref:RHS repeat-associated core domain-containing protein n=1 Tax=Saccharopolyspora sp. NPDC049357 TaxID=3154507 RepID=UPI00341EE099
MTNPLVAQREDSTQSYSGIQIAESVADTQKAIESGDWAGGVLGAVGTGLDALGMALDPFGAIFSAGVGWLIEHVGPVSDALDSLTGDPDEIKAHSETWKNVSAELEAINTEMKDLVKADTASWLGEAGDAYRKRSEDTANLIAAAKSAADGAADGIGTAGEVVAAVRTLVRDIIAELVGHLISWALQVVCTLGIALAWVVPQVVAEVAKVAAKIADITTKLIQAMKKLSPLLKKLGDSFGDTKKALDKIKADNTKNDGPASTKPVSDTPASTRAAGADNSAPTHPSNAGPGSPNSPSNYNGSAYDNPGSGPSPTTPASTNTAGAQSTKTRDDAVPAEKRNCGTTEPVDLATGSVVMSEVDLEILGPLHLVLERMHVSSYRAGRWFGATWASTLDQRLEIDHEHVRYFSPDGMILFYPLPAGDAPVLPIDGPRWPLSLREDGYVITEQGRELHFGRSRGVLPLLRIEDDDGRRIDIEHTPYGPPKELRHSDGYHVVIDSDEGKPTAVRVLDERRGLDVVVVRYGYDARGRLSEVINSSGIPLRFDYDDADRLTGWQDRVGSWFRYVYDEHGRCVQTVGDKGYFDATISYDGLVTRHTNSLGGVAEYHFNEAKQLVREVDQLGGATVSEWDRYDRLLSRTDPLGRTTSYEYVEHERPAAITRSDGSVVELHWDGGSIESIGVHDGERTWTRTYPEGERPDPFGGKVGSAPEFSLDLLESGRRATGGGGEAGAAPEQSRDLFGRLAERTTPSGGRTQHGWTVEGLPSWQLDARGGKQQWRYDPEGNELARIDELGEVSASEYGPFEVVTGEVDATGARTVREFDTERNLLSVTNPQGQTWRYTYDLAGRVVEECDFDGRVLRYAYDDAGQLVRSVNGMGEVTEYVYDVLGNMIEWRAPSGVTSYAYSPIGFLVRAANADAVLEFEWDVEGRILAETTNGRTVTFAYDDENNTIRRTTPSGVDSTWSFDENGAAHDLSFAAHAMRFEYDAAGRETARSLNDAVRLSQSYEDELLASQAVTGSSGQDVVRRRFSYRADNRLTGVQDSAFGQAGFELDQVGRVVEVIAPDRHERYRYDALGNVLGSEGVANAEDGPRRYSGNTLVASGGVGYQYDAQGRLVLRAVQAAGNWHYSWDSHDRLVAVITPQGVHWRYRYDPVGRRIAKQRLAPGPDGGAVVAEQVDFVWDGATLIEQIHIDAHGRREVTTWEHRPDDDVVVAQLERDGSGERFHSILTDAVGKPTDLVAADGQLTWHDRTSLWGSALPGQRSAATPLRFPGQYADAETGLNYNVYRYYDPATGRYLSQDPLGLAPAANPVTYVGNPHEETDALGLAPTKPTRKHAATGHVPRAGKGGQNAASLNKVRSGRVTKSRNSGTSKPKAPNGRVYRDGTYGDRNAERNRLNTAHNYKIDGDRTHQSEHVAGYDVLKDNGGDKGKRTDPENKPLENNANAYYEDRNNHRYHPGTGSNSPAAHESGFTKGDVRDAPNTKSDAELKEEGKLHETTKGRYEERLGSYRHEQRARIEDNDPSSAVQLNQLGYAHQQGFKNSETEAAFPGQSHSFSDKAYHGDDPNHVHNKDHPLHDEKQANAAKAEQERRDADPKSQALEDERQRMRVADDSYHKMVEDMRNSGEGMRYEPKTGEAVPDGGHKVDGSSHVTTKPVDKWDAAEMHGARDGARSGEWPGYGGFYKNPTEADWQALERGDLDLTPEQWAAHERGELDLPKFRRGQD